MSSPKIVAFGYKEEIQCIHQEWQFGVNFGVLTTLVCILKKCCWSRHFSQRREHRLRTFIGWNLWYEFYNLWFQQYDTPYHTAFQTIALLRTMLRSSVISHIGDESLIASYLQFELFRRFLVGCSYANKLWTIHIIKVKDVVNQKPPKKFWKVGLTRWERIKSCTINNGNICFF